MPFDITEFSSRIDRWGIQKASHYQVIITPPTSLDDAILSDVPYRANSANLPGYNVGFDEIKHRGYGLNEKRANMLSIEDITLTFIADSQGRLQSFFDKWKELIFPTNDSIVGTDNVELLEYPNNYFGSLEITMFDQTGAEHSTWYVEDLYPINVGAVQLSWESQDTILILPVSFAYRKYKLEEKYSSKIA